MGKTKKKRRIGVVDAYRRVRGDVLGDTGSLTGGVTKDVSVYARRGGLLSVLAGAAGKLQLVAVLVLLGIEHIAAFGAEAKADLLEVFGLEGVGGGRGGGGARHGGVSVRL